MIRNNQHKLFYMTGASGCGKTTLINYLKNNFDVQAIEVSARPYLPQGTSYDQSLTDDLQKVIVYHRTLSSLENLFNILANPKHFSEEVKATFFSRGPIDNLAYQRVLKKGQYFDSAVKREIEIIKEYGHIIYIPVEFQLKEEDALDTIRGVNEKIRQETDKEIWAILEEFDLMESITICSGSIDERKLILKEMLEEYVL